MKAVKKRLAALGYECREGDEISLNFCIEKVRSTIKNEINGADVPEGLEHVAVDMAAGEFLLAKKTLAPDDLALDLTTAVKEIKEGDTSVSFSIGEGSLTPEQRLAAFINYLLNYGKAEFASYRRLKW